MARIDGTVTVDIRQHIAVLSEKENGWRRELNIVDWNGIGPKWDIRDWSPDHERMSRGITLTQKEFDKLFVSMQHNAFRIEDAEVERIGEPK